MIDDAPTKAGGDMQTRTRLGEASPKQATDAPGGAHVDADEAYPGELMLVGDPRPQ